MTSFEKIKNACESIDLPAFPDFDTGDSDTYVVYGMAAETPYLFGDDEPNAIVTDLQAHLYMLPSANFFDTMYRLKRAIFDQGFTYPSVVLNALEDDSSVRHIVLEFSDDTQNV